MTDLPYWKGATRRALEAQLQHQLATMVRQGLDVALREHTVEMISTALNEACEAAIVDNTARNFQACRVLQAQLLITQLETPGVFVTRSARVHNLARVKGLLK